MRVRAAVIEGADRPLRVEEVDLVEPGPGEVLVRMAACGICRSDVHVAGSGETIAFPAVLGHEGAGVVEVVGEGVDLPLGAPVVLSWSPHCGRCPRCVEGAPQLCESLTTFRQSSCLSRRGEPLGTYMGLGALAEAVVVPEAAAVRVPDDLPLESLCLLGCGVTTGYGAEVHAGGVRPGEQVTVFGCGAVGLSAVQGARIAGASMIVAVEPDPRRRALADRVGATHVVDPGADDAWSTVGTLTEGGADVAVEATGVPEVMERLLDAVRPGGRAVVVGLAALAASISVSPFHLLMEKHLTGSIYGSADPWVDIPLLANLYEQGRLDLDVLRGNVYALDEVNEAVAELAEGRSPRPVVAFDGMGGAAKKEAT